jgi:hypothetical protein
VAADIIRREQAGGRTRVDVRHDVMQYTIWITPAHGMNHEVVGFRAWIANATLLHATEEAALAAAMRAIERIRAPRADASTTTES